MIATAGANRVLTMSLHSAQVHGFFSVPVDHMIDEIVATDTVPIPPEKRLPNMTILSIAPLLAEAIRSIHLGKSVSRLFDGTE